MIEHNPEHLYVKTDIENMFGAAKRKEGTKNVLADDRLRPWHRVLNMETYPESEIFYKDSKGQMAKAPWKYSEGGQQSYIMSNFVNFVLLHAILAYCLS